MATSGNTVITMRIGGMLPQALTTRLSPSSSTANPATAAQNRRRRMPQAMLKKIAANTTPATGLRTIDSRNRQPNARASHHARRTAAFQEASGGMD
ncbi:MAG TPA: hypothetical protein VME43_02950 [Bryobacteraceae bacterium]|nr:hypothetical protein [Bryobacteraceae bacterium]